MSDRQDAITAMGSIASSSFAPYRARAEALLNDPEALDQDQFGVCGMSSCVYLLLKHDPKKFADLVRAIFLRKTFNKIPMPTWSTQGGARLGDVSSTLANTHFRFASKMLAAKLEARTLWIDQYQLARQHGYNKEQAMAWAAQQKKKKEAQTVPKDNTELDFILSRGLGEIMQSANPQLYQEQVTFSEQFVEHFSSRNRSGDTALLKGDLAVTVDGLKYLMKDVLGADTVASATGKLFATRIYEMNRFFEHPESEPFAFGLVNGWGVAHSAPGTVSTPAPPGTGVNPPKYTHVIIVRDKIRKEGSTYVVPIWTWATSKEITFDSAVVSSYFYGFVFGKLLKR